MMPRCIDSCQCLRQTRSVGETLRVIDRVEAGELGGAACCAPLARTPLSPDGAADLAGLLKALADPTRLRLLSMIQSHEGGEACVCELTDPLGLTQPTVSHHLKVLADAGLVQRDKRGVWAYYRAVPATLQMIADLIAPPVD
jgi:ArsR family transcriptional regulator, arsenate/arsenite/antimonite-responsive transcriptional repressor